MNTLKCIRIGIVLCIFTSMFCSAHAADITVIVKGIKEVKGRMMVAVGDKSKPQEMKYDMVEVISKDNIICTLNDVPAGIYTVYVYQDLNNNYQLDMDEEKIPVEPCNTKERITVKEGENKVEMKLMNIKEMMGKESK